MSTIATVNIDINRDEVCRRLNYKNRSPSQSILSLIDSQIAKAYKFIKPIYAYELRAVKKVEEQEVIMAETLLFHSKVLSYVLSDCNWGVIYLASIGNDLGEETSRLMGKGETLEAYIMDIVGNEAVAQTLYKLRDVIKEMAQANQYQATVQYAPGYCDWDVSQQKVLFQAINSTSLGVTLTESCIMVPLKSTSGIIGIGKFERTKPPPCLAVCSKRTSCTHKRVGWDPEKNWLL